MWICNECETKNSDSDRFCACCGAARPITAAPKTDSGAADNPGQSQTAPQSAHTPSSGSPRTAGGFCPNCGQPIAPNASYCVKCGARLKAPAADARPAAPDPAPKKGKSKGILLALVILALTYGGGRLLGGQMARSTGDTVAPTPAVVEHEPVKAVQTQAPIQTPTPTPAPTATPRPAVWNFLEATDEEIWDLTAYFWGGTDPSTGAKCVFFADQNAERGGYYWWISNEEGHKASFALGTFSVDSSGRDILMTPDKDIPLMVDNYGDGSDGSILFDFGTNDFIDGQMRLYWDDSLKDTAIKYILAYKKFENSWQ